MAAGGAMPAPLFPLTVLTVTALICGGRLFSVAGARFDFEARFVDVAFFEDLFAAVGVAFLEAFFVGFFAVFLAVFFTVFLATLPDVLRALLGTRLLFVAPPFAALVLAAPVRRDRRASFAVRFLEAFFFGVATTLSFIDSKRDYR